MPPLEICRPGPGPLWPVRKYGYDYNTVKCDSRYKVQQQVNVHEQSILDMKLTI